MSELIIYIVVLFFIIGAVDELMGNRFGFGERFKAGLQTMGSLAVVIVGIVSLAPVIAKVLIPVVTPIYSAIGADPATFANTILAIDMGGYALAEEMALSREAGLFAWVFLGTTIGATIIFTIPVALGMIQKQDQPYFAQGILIGLMTIPFGAFLGGVLAGFSVDMLIRNLIPTTIISLIIGIGLWKLPNQMVKSFTILGRLVEIMAMVGFVGIVVETLTGYVIIPGLAPIEEGITIIGMIAIYLAGAFPMVLFISKAFKKPLEKLSAILKINATATAGIVATLAHNIPMISLVKEMDPRGKVISIAFSVSAAFVFGSHLGFVAGIVPELVFPMIVGKLSGGISAVIIAILVLRNQKAGNS